MGSTSEEERRREKIKKNSQVAEVAARGIQFIARGDLSKEQIEQLIACDDDWLDAVGMIAPELLGPAQS